MDSMFWTPKKFHHTIDFTKYELNSRPMQFPWSRTWCRTRKRRAAAGSGPRKNWRTRARVRAKWLWTWSETRRNTASSGRGTTRRSRRAGRGPSCARRAPWRKSRSCAARTASWRSASTDWRRSWICSKSFLWVTQVKSRGSYCRCRTS